MTPEQTTLHDELDTILRDMTGHCQNMVIASWDLPSPLPVDLMDKARQCWHSATNVITQVVELGEVPSHTMALLHTLTDRVDRVRELFT